jgi:hypothetical protein
VSCQSVLFSLAPAVWLSGQLCTALCCAGPCWAVLCCIVPCCAVPCRAAPRCTVLPSYLHFMLSCAVSCSAVLCAALLLQEYLRAAHVLAGIDTPVAVFLRCYALYLAGEKRKE